MKTVKIEVGDFIEFHGDTFQIHTARWPTADRELTFIAGRACASSDGERIPFDLEAAKRGEALVTRDGRKARFVAHVPEAGAGCRVLAIVDGNGFVTDFAENGLFEVGYEDDIDLFMAPKTKRTVYINVRPGPNYGRGPAEWFDCEAEAKAAARQFPGCIAAVAEIEA